MARQRDEANLSLKSIACPSLSAPPINTQSHEAKPHIHSTTYTDALQAQTLQLSSLLIMLASSSAAKAAAASSILRRTARPGPAGLLSQARRNISVGAKIPPVQLKEVCVLASRKSAVERGASELGFGREYNRRRGTRGAARKPGTG